MESVEGDADEEIYFSAGEEELPSRAWTEDDEMSVAGPSASGGDRQASSASLLSSASSATTAERPGRRRVGFAQLLVHLAWFDSLAALCVDALFFFLLQQPLAIDLVVLALSAARSFGSLTLAAAFFGAHHSEQKYIFMLILSVLLFAACIFSSSQTIAVLLRTPFNNWLSSFATRLHLSSCVLNILDTALFLVTSAMIIAFVHDNENTFISPHFINRKRKRHCSSGTSSHYIEV